MIKYFFNFKNIYFIFFKLFNQEQFSNFFRMLQLQRCFVFKIKFKDFHVNDCPSLCCLIYLYNCSVACVLY